jgi:hypothetical protein
MRPYLKKEPSQKRAGGVAQVVRPEFKPPVSQKKKTTKKPEMCFLTVPEASRSGSSTSILGVW